MDFAALPPEINSARMYTGAGSGPLMAAAAAWDGVAAELSSAATSYRGVIAELTDDMWLGPSSMSMSTAAASFAAWMGATAAQAEQTANQIRSAAAAYEAAFAAMVPPPVIEANRALLANLVATNVIGQNTAAIAATEAQYSEMWAQDAAAMFGYAGASAAATKVTPFTPAPHTTNPAGTAAQSAATAHAAASATANTVQSTLSSVPNLLNQLSSGPLASAVSSNIIDPLETLYNSFGGFALGEVGVSFIASGVLYLIFPMIATSLGPLVAALSATPVSAVTPELGAGLGTLAGSSAPAGAAGLGGVSAGLGEAELVGGLSVPPSWGTASPAIRLASAAVPLSGADAAPAAGVGAPGGFFGGLPPMASVVNAPRGNDSYSRGLRSKVLGQQDGGKRGAAAHTRSRATPPQHGTFDKEIATVSGQDLLDQLRGELADLSNERDVLKQTAAFLLEEAGK
ncbi:PPE family protein [Mycobacterium botniense]|uniref:PPE family protein n=1 Tax=Mycobacterium botniense TaxID=84962 RepID=UPI0013D7DB70